MKDITITFKQGNSTHQYILSRNGVEYTGDIRYITKQTSVVRRTFKLKAKESHTLRHKIIEDYTQWNQNRKVKVRY